MSSTVMRSALVLFMERFDSDWTETVYPDLVESQFAGVYVKQLQNWNRWTRSLKESGGNFEYEKSKHIF